MILTQVKIELLYTVHCTVFFYKITATSSLQLQYIILQYLFSFASNYNLIIRKYLQYKYLIYDI